MPNCGCAWPGIAGRHGIVWSPDGCRSRISPNMADYSPNFRMPQDACRRYGCAIGSPIARASSEYWPNRPITQHFPVIPSVRRRRNPTGGASIKCVHTCWHHCRVASDGSCPSCRSYRSYRLVPFVPFVPINVVHTCRSYQLTPFIAASAHSMQPSHPRFQTKPGQTRPKMGMPPKSKTHPPPRARNRPPHFQTKPTQICPKTGTAHTPPDSKRQNRHTKPNPV